MAKRVLVVAHNDPRITNGGAEIAAWRLYAELAARSGIEAWFLGCTTQPGFGRDGVALTQPFGPREFLYTLNGPFDWFKFANQDPAFPDELADLLLTLRPDIIHLAHYAHFGVEIVQLARRVLPDVRLVLTLHEYLAICNHFGQMVKRAHYSLCSEASPAACNACFPDRSTADFFLRKLYIDLAFRRIDHFVCPSRFLLERYAAWGIERSRLSVIENITATGVPDDAAPEPPGAGPPADRGALRIGFFGQISKLKGAALVMACAEMLNREAGSLVSFEIYGDYSSQPQEFQEEFLAQLAACTSNVNFRGKYTQDQVDTLMRGVDAVLVPSIWWENSPVVIQEAFRNRRPVICADIGGMAEKVRHGLDGFHFSVGSAVDLCALLRGLDQDRERLAKLQHTLRRPEPAADLLERHLQLYDRLLEERLPSAA
jgi:glycosyltransferase involved in cell wall biosynthesis